MDHIEPLAGKSHGVDAVVKLPAAGRLLFLLSGKNVTAQRMRVAAKNGPLNPKDTPPQQRPRSTDPPKTGIINRN